MKTILTLALLAISSFTFSQSSLNDLTEEKIVNFTSVLIDYEIYKGKTVALTKDNGEYYIYYTDSSGAGLFQTFDMFFATDLELDKNGRLFVIGVDSAYHISVGNTVEKIASYSKADYQRLPRTKYLLFDETVAYTNWGSLTFERIYDVEDETSPILAHYQFGESVSTQYSSRTTRSSTGTTSHLDQKLVEDRSTNIKNDIVENPQYERGATFTSLEPSRSRIAYAYNPHDLVCYNVNDSLWLINETLRSITVYTADGVEASSKLISDYPKKNKIFQDDASDRVYFLSSVFGTDHILELDKNGTLIPRSEIRKGAKKSDLKIANGYLYYRDTKGPGESIKRVKLD